MTKTVKPLAVGDIVLLTHAAFYDAYALARVAGPATKKMVPIQVYRHALGVTGHFDDGITRRNLSAIRYVFPQGVEIEKLSRKLLTLRHEFSTAQTELTKNYHAAVAKLATDGGQAD